MFQEDSHTSLLLKTGFFADFATALFTFFAMALKFSG